MDSNKGEQSTLGTQEGMGERKPRENARDPSPTGVPPLACLPSIDGGAVDTSTGTLRAQSQRQARNDFNSQFEYQQLIPLQFWGDEYASKLGIRGNMNAGDLESPEYKGFSANSNNPEFMSPIKRNDTLASNEK